MYFLQIFPLFNVLCLLEAVFLAQRTQNRPFPCKELPELTLPLYLCHEVYSFESTAHCARPRTLITFVSVRVPSLFVRLVLWCQRLPLIGVLVPHPWGQRSPPPWWHHFGVSIRHYLGSAFSILPGRRSPLFRRTHPISGFCAQLDPVPQLIALKLRPQICAYGDHVVSWRFPQVR